MKEVIEFFGGATYSFLCVTALLGLAKWKLRVVWIKPKYHYIAAIITLTLATTHLILISLLAD